MQTTLTIMGLENWLNNENKSMFNIKLPEGIDKETLTNEILLRCGEFECVYSNPYFMIEAVNNWSKKWYRTFDKWVKNLKIEYDLNPLENYDRYEDTTRDNTGTVKNDGSLKGSAKDFVSAFNSDTMRDNSATNSESKSDNITTNNLKEGVKSHIHGNIGVTTSSQLLREAQEVARFNLYNQIADIFIQEFCILIY